MNNNVEFRLWSELNSKAREKLKPDLGLRNWNNLTQEEKYKIWNYLIDYFIIQDPQNKKRILYSIILLNELYKVKSYAKNFLERRDLKSAVEDFKRIFLEEDQDVVFELLSLYALSIFKYPYTYINKWEDIDKFAERINDIFTQFGINVHLTRLGFIPRQEKKIIEEIYEPVLKCLSDSKWKEVSQLLSDAFDEYRKHTPQGYSDCITKTFSAIQAFLQILVYGKTGKGNFADLIKEAREKNLIPSDPFTQTIFKNIESVISQIRKEYSIAHPPSKGYANEKNARLILNLAMIFIQHCL